MPRVARPRRPCDHCAILCTCTPARLCAVAAPVYLLERAEAPAGFCGPTYLQDVHGWTRPPLACSPSVGVPWRLWGTWWPSGAATAGAAGGWPWSVSSGRSGGPWPPRASAGRSSSSPGSGGSSWPWGRMSPSARLGSNYFRPPRARRPAGLRLVFVTLVGVWACSSRRSSLMWSCPTGVAIGALATLA